MFAITDNGSSATLKWTYNFAAGAYCNTAVAIRADGMLIVPLSDGTVLGLVDAESSATLQWTFTSTLFQANGLGFVVGAAIVDSTGNVFLGAYGLVYGVNGNNGAMLWDYVMTQGDYDPAVLCNTPAVGNNGYLYIACGPTLMYFAPIYDDH